MTLSGTPKSGLDLRSSSFSDSNSAAQSAASSRKRQTQFFASVISRALALETEKKMIKLCLNCIKNVRSSSRSNNNYNNVHKIRKAIQ